jgi:hypothetical protein
VLQAKNQRKQEKDKGKEKGSERSKVRVWRPSTVMNLLISKGYILSEWFDGATIT